MSSPSPVFLPTRHSDRQVFQLFRDNGWPLIGALPPALEIGASGQLVFRQGPDGRHLRWVQDILIGFPYLVVEGPDAEARAQDLGPLVWAWTAEEVLSYWDEDPSRWPWRCLLLGLLAPPEYEPRIARRLREALDSEDAHLRSHALIAVGYRLWPEWKPLLEALAAREPEEPLRGLAAAHLEALDTKS